MSRILVADDDDSFRTMLRLTLEKMGHEVFEAPNGNEAVLLFESITVDLVMTDLIMPGKEGLETIDELRRKHRGIKIIAMSGGGRATPMDYLKTAKLLGATRVLAKPFSNQDLAEAVGAVLGILPA